MNSADPKPQPPGGDQRLTKCERQILRMVDAGIARKVIANQRCISIETVQTHLKNVRSKLAVSSIIAALDKARKLGLLE